MDISSEYTLADCARFKAERDALAQRMEEIASEIDRTLSGVEGIEDAPALRWMRGLREALGALHSPRISYEDIEAAKWVRGHGGLDEVNRKVAESMQQADEYIALRCSLAERSGDMYEMLDKEDDELVSLLDERLMPEGMEWPRFEDGEPVRIGDEFAERIYGNPCKVGHFAINKHAFLIFDEEDVNDCEAIDHGTYKRVKRPAPKVLDAEGVEIGIGDKLYDTETGCARIVRAINASGTVEFEGYEDCGWFTRFLTHRAPVLAADGKPLREGEMVYEIKTGERYFVTNVFDGTTEPDFPEHTVECRKYEDVVTHMFKPSQLTHERPDSWERLREDMDKVSSCEYFGRSADESCDGCRAFGADNCGAARHDDEIIRAKKLAERGQ